MGVASDNEKRHIAFALSDFRCRANEILLALDRDQAADDDNGVCRVNVELVAGISERRQGGKPAAIYPVGNRCYAPGFKFELLNQRFADCIGYGDHM